MGNKIDEQMKHVIVTVSYNDTESTLDFINQFLRLKNVYKLIVVDNCSTNGLYNNVSSYIRDNNLQACVDCIKSERNGGYAYGNNYGIKYAIKNYSPDIISISNSDVILNDIAISTCIDFLLNHSNAGLVAPKMVTVRKQSTRASWNQPTYWNIIIDNLMFINPIKSKIHNMFRKNSKIVISEEPVDVIMGSFYMARTSTFEKINFLDERTFLYGEENILGIKIKSINMQNYILNNITYIHNHSASINTNIKSVEKRLEILHDSLTVYLVEYLNIKKIGMLFFDISYKIGKFLYITLKIKR